ncbi:cell wall hydrolase [Faucicola mancuniensis]|uniref:cell wall hydrolase n=1 Tax=Faucicola mancuniensis TaxID=1309795 RepID=UPI0039773E7A
MALNYDPQGFIIGLGRVERQTSLLHDDTQTIIRILSSQATINQTQLTDINQRLGQLNQTTRIRNQRNRQTSIVGEQTSRQSNRHLPASAREIGNTTNTPVRQHQNRQNTPTERLRDSNGRFTSQAEEISFIQKLSDMVAKNVADVGVDDRNLDPLVESMHEVYDTVKPMGKMLGLMWRMGAWTKNKLFARKRNEPLSQAQYRHNRTVEEHLENIADNGNRGGMFGLLSELLTGGLGLLMAGGKGAFKLLKKGGWRGLGALGALFGVGNLALNSGNMNAKQKSAGVGSVGGGIAGAMAGASIGTMVFPGVGTVVGGILGGWLGSEGGEALGKTVSPYIQNWTNGLKNYNLGDKMQKAFFFGLSPFFVGASAIFEWVKTKAKDLFNLDLPTPNNVNPNTETTTDSMDGATGFLGDNSTFSNGNINITETDIVRLAKVMQSEVGKSGFDEKWRADMGGAVLDSVLNRTVAKEFPDTIKGVINQKNQFSGINGLKSYKDKYGKVHQTGSPGDVDKYQAPSAEALNFTRQYLAKRASGGSRLVDTTDFLNPHVSGANAMQQWGNKAVAEAKAKGTVYGKGNYVHYHAGKKVGNYGINLSGSANSTQSKKLEQLASQSDRFGNNRVVVGDSIGVQYNQVHGSDKSTAVNGQNPSQVLGQIQSLIKAGTINKNTQVVLSSGLSNSSMSTSDYDIIKQQLGALQKVGANTRLLGVANNFKDNTKQGTQTNKILEKMATLYHAEFQGGFNYNSSDKYKAHPANSYFNGKAWAKPKTQTQTAKATAKKPNVTATNIPKSPKVSQQLSTDKGQKQLVASQNQIPQNVSDKSLAHAITGGLGADRVLV